MTVPRNLVDAWTWADGWRIVRPTTDEARIVLEDNARERGIREVGAGEMIHLFVLEPSGGVVVPLSVWPRAFRDGIRRISMGGRYFWTKKNVGAADEKILLEGLWRFFQCLSVLRSMLFLSAASDDFSQLFSSDQLARKAEFWLEAAENGQVENEGSPSPGGEIAMLLGELPPEFTASMDELREET